MSKDKEHCGSCGTETKTGGCFGAPGKIVCLACKLRLAAAELIASPFAHKWHEANQDNLWYFVENLGHLYRASVRDGSLGHVLGPAAVGRFSGQWEKLMAFAKTEEESYGFSPIEFSLARFEHTFSATPAIMDFWLSAAVVYDMRNYLYDLQELTKKQRAAMAGAVTSTKAPAKKRHVKKNR